MEEKAVAPAAGTLDDSAIDPRLSEELDAMFWILDEVRQGRKLPVIEADAVAHSLYVALQHGGPGHLPQLPLRDMNSYVAVHSVNTALLAMAVGEHEGLQGGEVRDLGMAALLHDVGMALMPDAVVEKEDELVATERQQIRQHPVEGARIIIESDVSLELAAVVAYEHHIKLDGSGYPELTYRRSAHYAARLVQLCDIYHALSTPRPFRERWPRDIVFSFIRERSGFEFDPELGSALMTMIQARTAAGPQEA